MEIAVKNEKGETEFRALRRMLELSRGTSSLTIAACPGVRERRHWTTRLCSEISEVVEIPVRFQPSDPLQEIEFLLSEAPEGSVILLTGLERLFHGMESEVVPILEVLNRSRERWAALFAGPIVLWTDYRGLRLLAARARDLWAWVAHEFEFPPMVEKSEKTLSRERFLGGDELVNLPREVREARLAELTYRLDEMGDSPRDADVPAYQQWWTERLGLLLVFRRYDEAARLTRFLQEHAQSKPGWENFLLMALFTSGRIAEEQEDDDFAWENYEKGREIAERLGEVEGLAAISHQLGNIALRRHDFSQALEKAHQTLAIYRDLGQEGQMSDSYFQLGRIAMEQRDLENAEEWLQKSREIVERLKDDYRCALIYYHLGRLANERLDDEKAEAFYRQAKAIYQKLGDDLKAAVSSYFLGEVLERRPDWAAAATVYLESTERFAAAGDSQGLSAAMTRYLSLLSRVPDARLRGRLENAGRSRIEKLQATADSQASS